MTGRMLNKLMKYVVKLSATEYTKDGFKITDLGKFCLTFFSPFNLLVAYLLSEAFSIPKADKLINCSREFFKAKLDRRDGKSECIKLKSFCFFS